MGEQTFGQMIRRRRLAAKLSQESLAGQAGTDRSHLSKIERGTIGTPSEPLRSELIRVVEQAERDLGIPVEHIIGPIGGSGIGITGSVALKPIAPKDDRWTRVVFSGMPSLSEAGRRALAEQFEFIKRIEDEYRREAERDAAENRGED